LECGDGDSDDGTPETNPDPPWQVFNLSYLGEVEQGFVINYDSSCGTYNFDN
jgi:hypothetical protein